MKQAAQAAVEPIPDEANYQLPAELAATSHPVVEAEQRAGAIVARVMAGVSAMLHEHMQAVKLELRAVTNDNSVLRQNLAVLNAAMADFQRLQVIPLREKLDHLDQEVGSRMVENSTNLEGLIKALSDSLAAKGALIPEDLKQRILDGRFEELPHVKDGEMVPSAEVQSMIDAAFEQGRKVGKREARHGST
jgi:hypothetical protein